MTKLVNVLCLLLLFVSSFCHAGKWLERRSKLDKVAIYDHFRVFYTLKGRDALPQKRQVDLDKNGIPDFIDKVGGRLLETDQTFTDDVGLTPPLKNKRYRGKAFYIDINVLRFSKEGKGPKNGIAYDGIVKFNRELSEQTTTRVLAIDLSSSVRLQSNSIEHELFHIYQNGYTYFKNRWYTEGTARWSELINDGKLGKSGELPKTLGDKHELYNKSYDAKGFWNALIHRVDKKSKGKVFIRHLLEQLDRLDNLAAINRGISPVKWKESEQRSSENSDYIWLAIINALNKTDPSFAKDKEIMKLKHL